MLSGDSIFWIVKVRRLSLPLLEMAAGVVVTTEAVVNAAVVVAGAVVGALVAVATRTVVVLAEVVVVDTEATDVVVVGVEAVSPQAARTKRSNMAISSNIRWLNIEITFHNKLNPINVLYLYLNQIDYTPIDQDVQQLNCKGEIF